MFSCLALGGQLAFPQILCSPRAEPQGGGIHLCSATWLSQHWGPPSRRKGYVQRGTRQAALTSSLPTAVCGGTSWPADAAPHRPGRYGRLCGAHDHRAGAAGELPCSGGQAAGGGSSRGHQTPKCLSQPQAGEQHWRPGVGRGGCPRPGSAPLTIPGVGLTFCLLRLAPSIPLPSCLQMAPRCLVLSHHRTSSPRLQVLSPQELLCLILNFSKSSLHLQFIFRTALESNALLTTEAWKHASSHSVLTTHRCSSVNIPISQVRKPPPVRLVT